MSHVPECPAGRDHHHLCICEVLRMIRLADKASRDKRERDDARRDR